MTFHVEHIRAKQHVAEKVSRKKCQVPLLTYQTPFVILDSMGRPARAAQSGLVYHTLNRANARLAIFHDDGDFAAFERILAEAVTRFDMRLLAYCLMPNHFHVLLWPRGDGDLSQFMQWLSLTHTQRWHAHHHTAGSGHLYQVRFKSFPANPTSTSSPFAATSSEMRCAPA
jgi:REP element-mobilizing transposase RayT